MAELSTKGKCIILSAPSGAGKTSIAKKLLEDYPNLEFSISACSRPPRKNETNEKDYYFLSIEEFKSKIEENAFLEWEEVYPNHFYGTLQSEVERIWAKGNAVIFDVDVKGGINLKNKLGDQALSIFVVPPSIEILLERLKSRSTESQDEIMLRMNKAEFEISYASKFDEIIKNDVFETAIFETEKIINQFLSE